MEPIQLPLRIGLRDSATLANFLPGANGAAIAALESGYEPFVYLWGAPGTGKSHLLQGLCQQFAATGGAPVYLPLGDEQLAPEMCEGLEAMPLVCLDDIQAVAGNREWETALFHLYNRVRDAGGRLLVAADAPPGQLGIDLPDLRSRLGWGPVFHLQPLSDEEKVEALILRARGRGIELAPDVARYLMRRYRRDTHGLFELLEQLDRASLAAQRRLTIPFVRELLGG
jgi:DnaA family protein